MPALVYLDSAIADFEDIAMTLTYRTQDITIARDFVSQLQQRCTQLAGLPGTLGQLRPEYRDDIRSVPHGNYVIFFRYAGDDLEVVKIVDARRDLRRLSFATPPQ